MRSKRDKLSAAEYIGKHSLPWKKLLVPTLTVLPAAGLYITLLLQIPSRHPQWWFGVLGISIAAYTALSIRLGKPMVRVLSVFTAGGVVAGASMFFGSPWISSLYLLYAFGAGAFFGSLELGAAVLSAGAYLLGSDYFTIGAVSGQTAMMFVLTVLAASMAYAAHHAVTIRKNKLLTTPDKTDSPPLMEGLDGEEDHELSEIIRAVALTLKPDCITLFLYEDGELTLRVSTAGDAAASGEGLAYDVLRYRHTLVSQNLEDVHYGPGYTRTGRMVSAVAVPVLDGTYIAGVLVADSSHEEAFSQDDSAVVEVFASQVAGLLSERRIHEETQTSVQWLSLLNSETSRLTSSLEPGAIVRMAADAMQKIAPGDIYFFLRRQSTSIYVLMHNTAMDAPVDKAPFSMNDTLTGMAIDDKATKYFTEVGNYPFPPLPFDTPSVRSALMVPLLYHGEPQGIAVMVSKVPSMFGPREAEHLSLFGNHVAVSLKNAMLHADIKKRALTDGLTGLINHRHFMERLAAEFKRFDRTGEPLTMLLFDADHFKRVNDNYGHPAGDQVLRDLASIMRSTLRAQDVQARYGGEEFAAALPDTPPDSATLLAERLRSSVEDFRFSYNGTHIPVTISIGLATCPFDDTTVHGLIQKADQALYRAKEGGRNRVERWSEEGSAQPPE